MICGKAGSVVQDYLLSVLDVDAILCLLDATAGEVVDGTFSITLILNYNIADGGLVGGLDGLEGCLVGELELAIACPVEREAYEAHGETTEDAVLLVVATECAVGQYNGSAIGRTTGTDGLGSSEGLALVGGECYADILAASAIGKCLECDIPGVALKGRAPYHVLAVAGVA